MTSQQRLERGYVMVACVPFVRRKNGKRDYAHKHGKRCFPIWRKPGRKTTKVTSMM